MLPKLVPTVALDLDGVIVGCVEGVLALHLADCGPGAVKGWNGLPDAITEHQPDEIGQRAAIGWGVRYGMLPSEVADITTQRHLFPHVYEGAERPTITSLSVWTAVAAMGERFWTQLELLPWARQLVALAEEAVGPENVILVTTPQPDPTSWSGKMKWIRANLPDYITRVYMCKDKSRLARPNVLLVDDGPPNAKDWLAAGAPAYLWPMPWNTEGPSAYDSDGRDPLAALKSEIDGLIARCSAVNAMSETVDNIAKAAGLERLLEMANPG